jgi:hypothetical protein
MNEISIIDQAGFPASSVERADLLQEGERLCLVHDLETDRWMVRTEDYHAIGWMRQDFDGLPFYRNKYEQIPKIVRVHWLPDGDLGAWVEVGNG